MRKSILLLIITVVWTTVQAQTIELQADQKLSEFLTATEIPGLSISISQKGELIYSKGFGFSDLENQTPVDPSKTKFRFGSVSKTLTAAGLALLYQEGKVDLDVPIEKYVPVWPKKEDDITLRQLGGHLAGIRHYKSGEFYSSRNYPTVSDGLGIFVKDPLINKPGTEYSYSSYGWNLIAAAMEGAIGGGTFLQTSDFLQYMQQNVFDVIKMENTVAEHVNENIPNLTKFYEAQSGKVISAHFVDNSYKWAGGGFVGTTEDLCLFGQANMKAGFLNQDVLDEWMSSQKTTEGKLTNYGIGWRTFKRPNGQTYYGHSGGSVGGTTYFLIHKESETVLAITANLSPLNYNGLQFELMDMFSNNKN
jgi:serine beta-lactamase-like protein LACTB, mitochondrial